jgi:hypothetical protein
MTPDRNVRTRHPAAGIHHEEHEVHEGDEGIKHFVL